MEYFFYDNTKLTSYSVLTKRPSVLTGILLITEVKDCLLVFTEFCKGIIAGVVILGRFTRITADSEVVSCVNDGSGAPWFESGFDSS